MSGCLHFGGSMVSDFCTFTLHGDRKVRGRDGDRAGEEVKLGLLHSFTEK